MANRPSCGAFALPAQCSSPSMPGTSPVRPPARTMHQPIRARHVAGASPARTMHQPAAWSSFHRKTVIPPRRHNITQSHHDSALSQTYNTANSQCHCRQYAGSHRRRGTSQLPPYPRSPISLKPGSMQLLRAFHLHPAGWTQRARPAHGIACPNNLLHWDTFGVKIK